METNETSMRCYTNRLALISFIIPFCLPIIHYLAAVLTHTPSAFIFPVDGNLVALTSVIVFAVIGIILGFVAQRQIAHTQSPTTNRWMAKSGPELSVAVVIAFSLFALVLSSSRHHFSSLYCARNQRQLLVAVQVHAQDNQGVMPMRLVEVGGYIKKLKCPNAGEGSRGIGYNPVFGGKQLEQIQDTNNVLLIADGGNADGFIITRADIDETRHETGPYKGFYWNIKPWPRQFVVGYLDGHIEFLYTDATVRLKP